MDADVSKTQRQTVVSQFFQLDRLVVEGGKTVSAIGHCLAFEAPVEYGPANDDVV